MKNTHIFLVFIINVINISCNSQNINQKKFISNFINSIVLKDSVKVDELSYFLQLDDNSIKDNFKVIKFNIEFLKTELKAKNYTILTYNEFKSRKEFNDYEIIYSDVNKIYCIVYNHKFITLIIIDNNKIISFFTGIVKNKKRIFPYYFK